MERSSTETDFLKPLTNTLQIYMQIEILTAKNFEHDNIYIQYILDLSEDWKCLNPSVRYGVTQICKTKGNTANFSYNFEISLESDIRKLENNDIFAVPCIYFEIISRDSWDRYRCEGITYKSLPVFQPGLHEFELHCIKMHPKTLTGNLRRYFIGDYSSIDNITWAGFPKYYEGSTINKYGINTEGSGNIQIRLNILNQSVINGRNTNFGGRESIPLLRNFADVIVNYQRARDRMIKARKNILEYT